MSSFFLGFLRFIFLWKSKTFCCLASLFLLSGFLGSCSQNDAGTGFPEHVSTVAGKNREFGEPFGIAAFRGNIYISDGETGRILTIDNKGEVIQLASGLHTPSGIAFDKDGNLFAADSGTHTIKQIDQSGKITIIAGTEGVSGYADGPAHQALFNAPVGIALGSDGRIFVADTYNDRIRVIENGIVRTIAGGGRGFADGFGDEARFDTPLGLAIIDGDRLIAADAGNHRIRIVENDGRVWTLAGSGENSISDGLPGLASFSSPTSVAVSKTGVIYVADGNAIRAIGRRLFPFVETIAGHNPGLADGNSRKARFNRISGLAITDAGELYAADSENHLVRKLSADESGAEITGAEIAKLHGDAKEFRSLQPGRWPFDPPDRPREIAGTLGEIRGEMADETSQAWFHNGLDIPGGYGESARFIRTEKVLNPIAVENLGTLRELLRMPTLGYVHIRLGRDSQEIPTGDSRFLFEFEDGFPINLRIPRGTTFSAGEAIGTLNSMNHIHLIAGRQGYEFNAIDALELPGIMDTIPPVIQSVTLYTEDWHELETPKPPARIKINAKTRIVVQAYDRVNGSAERRKLAPFRLGFEVFTSKEPPKEPSRWNISFAVLPVNDAVPFVYANGSKSGASGDTVFRFTVTNYVAGADFEEGFLNPSDFGKGEYTLRVFAADYFGNIAVKDIPIEVTE